MEKRKRMNWKIKIAFACVLLLVAVVVILPKFQLYYEMYQCAVRGYKRLGTETNYPPANTVLKTVVYYGVLLALCLIPAFIIIAKTLTRKFLYASLLGMLFCCTVTPVLAQSYYYCGIDWYPEEGSVWFCGGTIEVGKDYAHGSDIWYNYGIVAEDGDSISAGHYTRLGDKRRFFMTSYIDGVYNEYHGVDVDVGTIYGVQLSKIQDEWEVTIKIAGFDEYEWRKTFKFNPPNQKLTKLAAGASSYSGSNTIKSHFFDAGAGIVFPNGTRKWIKFGAVFPVSIHQNIPFVLTIYQRYYDFVCHNVPVTQNSGGIGGSLWGKFGGAYSR